MCERRGRGGFDVDVGVVGRDEVDFQSVKGGCYGARDCMSAFVFAGK